LGVALEAVGNPQKHVLLGLIDWFQAENIYVESLHLNEVFDSDVDLAEALYGRLNQNASLKKIT